MIALLFSVTNQVPPATWSRPPTASGWSGHLGPGSSKRSRRQLVAQRQDLGRLIGDHRTTAVHIRTSLGVTSQVCTNLGGRSESRGTIRDDPPGRPRRRDAALTKRRSPSVSAAAPTGAGPRSPGSASLAAPRAQRRPVPAFELDANTMQQLYVAEHLDDKPIGARHGVPAWRVKVRRRELEISRHSVPPPRRVPPQPPTANVLPRLYLDEQTPIAVIAHRFGTATPTARDWLENANILIRPRTARVRRLTLDPAMLRELYTDREWSSAEIAAEFNTTHHTVLRALHDNTIPVRRRLPPHSAASGRTADNVAARRALRRPARQRCTPRPSGATPPAAWTDWGPVPHGGPADQGTAGRAV